MLAEIPVTLSEMTLGAEIEVPTIKGKAKMKIPPETQNGAVFRLRGLGLPFQKEIKETK